MPLKMRQNIELTKLAVTYLIKLNKERSYDPAIPFPLKRIGNRNSDICIPMFIEACPTKLKR
jgi:hypothetical protein